MAASTLATSPRAARGGVGGRAIDVNVQVAVRCRGLVPLEASAGAVSIVEVDESAGRVEVRARPVLGEPARGRPARVRCLRFGDVRDFWLVVVRAAVTPGHGEGSSCCAIAGVGWGGGWADALVV